MVPFRTINAVTTTAQYRLIPSVTQSQKKRERKKKTFLAPLFSHNPVESEPVPWRRRKIPGRDQCTSQTYANCPGTVDANLTSVRRPEYVEDVEP